MKFREFPGRFIVGAYVLHTGIEKWNGDEERAKAIHAMATQAYPAFETVAPKTFLRLLAAGEIAVGAALVTPVIPASVAGAALSGFSGGLMGLYARIPAMRKDNSLWPSSAGIAISKDSWIIAIGLGLIADAMTRRSHHTERRIRRELRHEQES